MRRQTTIAAATLLVMTTWVAPNVMAQDTPEGAAPPATAAPDATTPPAADAATAAPAEQREWFGSGRRWTEWSRMTGDWGSWRSALESKGLTVSFSMTADGSDPSRGEPGTRRVGRALLDFGAEFDLERAGLGPGRVFVGYQQKRGGIGTACVEDGQGFSNIDAPDFRRFAEVWYERPFGSAVRVKIGLSDANAEFAFVENGAEFINSSMGFSPSIYPMPTYPDPHLGLVVQTQPTAWSYAGVGVYNGGPALGVENFHAAFGIGETGLRWKGFGGGRAGVGAWHVRRRGRDGDGAVGPKSTSGQYLVLDQTLWSGGTGDGTRAVGAFVQVGLSDARYSPVARHVGAGVVASGLMRARPDDVFGFAVTTIRPGEDAARPGRLRGEFNLGGFYKFTLAGWLSLKPDVQVIVNPAGQPDRRTIVVSTVRFEAAF